MRPAVAGASVHSMQHAAARRDANLANIDLNAKPVFADPRENNERRKRDSVFFYNADERRHRNRRTACMIDSEWWISRKYTESEA